ncbi:hypothetical protein BDP27DRAFT_1435075 [Rhodocollybia butyracea]|uniref:Protein kinase domain-containing protein n=1 Tax=Rhodocollybia butyracea TaxID=206335 RepID=A0A9P5TWQ3_9AGAR|nr:hypothetical protein BDP27DRAFT_1435075 [Rhodocollybia butyracea]
MVVVVIRGYLGWWSNVRIIVYTDSGSARARTTRLRYVLINLYFVYHPHLSTFTTVSYAHPISSPVSSLTPRSEGGSTSIPPWIGEPYGSDENLDAEDKDAFKRTLHDVELGDWLDANGGVNNAGLYALHKDHKNYKGHKAGDVVVKCMQRIDNNAWGEVKALKTVGYFVDSGMVLVRERRKPKSRPKLTPAILMKKLDGVIPLKTSVWGQGRARRLELINSLEPKVKQEVVNWAVNKKILVTDFHLRNIHVVLTKEHTVKSVHVLDFGYPGVYTVKEPVEEGEVPPWIGEPYGNDENLDAEDKDAFRDAHRTRMHGSLKLMKDQGHIAIVQVAAVV